MWSDFEQGVTSFFCSMQHVTCNINVQFVEGISFGNLKFFFLYEQFVRPLIVCKNILFGRHSDSCAVSIHSVKIKQSSCTVAHSQSENVQSSCTVAHSQSENVQSSCTVANSQSENVQSSCTVAHSQ